MTDEKKMVIFTMPDGTAVSNDPEWHGLDEARKKVLASQAYLGHAGIENDDLLVQTQTDHPAPLNSAQPGVGDHATPDDARAEFSSMAGREALKLSDPVRYAELEAAGWPEPDGPELPDSNEEVLKAREVKAEKAKKALEESGAQPGDPDVPYEDWTGPQLKAEITARNAEPDRAEEDQLKPTSKKKADAAALLRADDERKAELEDDDDDVEDDEDDIEDDENKS